MMNAGTVTITLKDQDFLAATERETLGMHTSRKYPLRTAAKLHGLGLVVPIRLAVADGDGHIRQGCKERKAWQLTARGTRFLFRMRDPKREHGGVL